MEETLMMDDEELLQHIEELDNELTSAVEEAISRGYEDYDDLKESI